MDEIIHLMENIDTSLHYYIDEFGAAIYIMLFLIVYFKTGFVILTFLPGDSMVFASGTLAAAGDLNFQNLFMLFAAATFFGDSQNFFIGKKLGKLNSENHYLNRLTSERSIGKARDFLSDYGGVAITASRFVPLMRTSVPFVSGYTGYEYRTFLIYNIIGGLIWTALWLSAGFILGNISWVVNNLFLTLMIVSSTAFIPAIIGFVKQYRKKKEAIA